MKFTMNNQDLLEGLNIVTRALSSRPAKQILEGVLISAEDNQILLTCSDGSMSIEYTNAADVQEEGQAVLPGKLFTELIRKMPGGQVEINIDNHRTAQIKCQKARSNLAIMSAAEYPEIHGIDTPVSIKFPMRKLKDMISHVLFAIATDESRLVLTGALLEISPVEARMVSLDGFRLAMQKANLPFELPEDQPTVKAILPGKLLTELSHILSDEDEFCHLKLKQGRMQCTFKNIRISSVLVEGEYIDYRRIIPSQFKTQVKALRASVSDAIDRASLLAREGKNNLVKMSFHNQQLVISSNAEMGDVAEPMDVEMTGDELDIAFNAKYISDIIHNLNEEYLYMNLNSSVSPCVVTPPSGDEYLYLILPVRIFQ